MTGEGFGQGKVQVCERPRFWGRVLRTWTGRQETCDIALLQLRHQPQPSQTPLSLQPSQTFTL